MKKRIRRLVCKGCRGKFRTNPNRTGWRCPYCGGHRVIEISG